MVYIYMHVLKEREREIANFRGIYAMSCGMPNERKGIDDDHQ